jgi:hypothetical protein
MFIGTGTQVVAFVDSTRNVSQSIYYTNCEFLISPSSESKQCGVRHQYKKVLTTMAFRAGRPSVNT